MIDKWGHAVLAVCVIMLLVGTFWVTRSPRGAEVVCPSRPTYETEFAVRNYYEGVGRITFDTTEDMASDTKEFGDLYHDLDGGYTLYVNSRYVFQEVLDYLEAWGECRVMADRGIEISARGSTTSQYPAPTPTLEPSGVRIGDGPLLWAGKENGRCYVDVPECGYGQPCPLDWGREVSCDDWETTVFPTTTPTPDWEATISTSHSESYGSDMWLTRTPTPTATPNLVIQSYDRLDPLDKLLQDLITIALATEYTFRPKTTDVKLFIDWPGTITITDALSQTVVIKGPATVTFEEAE